jgi:hypothetical protein
VWKSSSVENLAADIEHKTGLIGCEYVEEGRATKPEEGDRTKAAGEEHSEAVELENEQRLEEKGRESFVLNFYMTYDAYNQPRSSSFITMSKVTVYSPLCRFFIGKKGTVPRVGEVSVHEHDVLQFCGVRPGDDLNTVLSKTIRFITPEMILTMLKHSVETQRGIVFRAVPVGREFADASENKELKVGDWILEARANPEQGIEQWVAHPMRSEATWLVRRFDERPFPHPPIPGHPISPGLQAQRVHFHGEETEC